MLFDESRHQHYTNHIKVMDAVNINFYKLKTFFILLRYSIDLTDL